MHNFRAWDKHENKMIDMGGLFSYDNPFTEPNLIIMLGCGMSDTSGTEIFAGDFIKFKGNWDKDGRPIPDNKVYLVDFVNGSFMGIPVDELNSSSAANWRHVGSTDSTIVGNSYEKAI